jgi:hypothetical protein
MASILAEIGLSDETLTSYNATMPITYYLFKGGKLKNKNSKKEIKKFLSVSMAKNLFGVASNSALNSTRNSLKSLNCEKMPFTLSLFTNVVLTGDRNFNVTEKDIEDWLNKYEKGKNTYVLLTLLYPNHKLNQVSFHQDHCHPHVGFDNKNIKNLKISDDKIKDWQRKRNLLPNLQFLEGKENTIKSKTPLKDWVAINGPIQYCPKDVSLELKDFDYFFESRKNLMKNELMNLFDIKTKNPI